MPCLREEIEAIRDECLADDIDIVEGMVQWTEEQLNTLLEKVGYFFPPDRAPATKLTLRNLLTKPGWNHLEVRTLRGVLSHLNRPRER